MLSCRSSIGRVLVCCAMLLSLSLVVCAQSAIRISRPLDGATVRETVNVLVPVSSVPQGGFITCIIDGRIKAATDGISQDGNSYVYRWDTKSVEVSPETGEIKIRPKDGKHTVAVQAFGSDGKKTGQATQITVYVKNDASSDMPANGLRLKYRNTIGSINQYHFKFTENIKSIEGATALAKAIGENVEGAEGTVERSIEDRMDGDSVLVRQKLIDTLVLYFAGTGIPQPDVAKAEYRVEDSLGHVTYVMASSSPGIPIGIDLPIFPARPVKIGDTWIEPMKIFKYALTGESAKLNASSTLEGLEWEAGQPCAKIKTQFVGMIRIPNSTLLKDAINVTGTAMTYFSYKVGKVVTFSVVAQAEPEVDAQALSAWFQQIMQVKNVSDGQNPTGDMTGMMAGAASPGSGAKAKMKLEFKQTIQLVK